MSMCPTCDSHNKCYDWWGVDIQDVFEELYDTNERITNLEDKNKQLLERIKEWQSARGVRKQIALLEQALLKADEALKNIQETEDFYGACPPLSREAGRVKYNTSWLRKIARETRAEINEIIKEIKNA